MASWWSATNESLGTSWDAYFAYLNATTEAWADKTAAEAAIAAAKAAQAAGIPVDQYAQSHPVATDNTMLYAALTLVGLGAVYWFFIKPKKGRKKGRR